MCSMSREPRRLEYTICTAVAPEAVLTVRTNGDTPTPYEPHSPGFSVQISAGHTTNTQVTGPPSQNPHDREPSRGGTRSRPVRCSVWPWRWAWCSGALERLVTLAPWLK